MSTRGVCSRCGCTDDRACDLGEGQPCWWLDAEKTLCSACVTGGELPDSAPYIYLPFPDGRRDEATS